VHRLDAWITERATNHRLLPGLETIAQVLWQIRCLRNNSIFRRQRPDPNRAIADALAQARIQHISTKSQQRTGDSRTGDSAPKTATLWKPPDRGFLKCDIDGSYHPGSQEGTMACISRNHQGILTDVYTRRFTAASAFQMEVQALTFTLHHLLHQGLNKENLVIESDCLLLIDTVHARQKPPWEERAMFPEIEALLSLYPNLQLRHCRREASGAADWVAKANGRSDLARDWNIFPPFIFASFGICGWNSFWM